MQTATLAVAPRPAKLTVTFVHHSPPGVLPHPSRCRRCHSQRFPDIFFRFSVDIADPYGIITCETHMERRRLRCPSLFGYGSSLHKVALIRPGPFRTHTRPVHTFDPIRANCYSFVEDQKIGRACPICPTPS